MDLRWTLHPVTCFVFNHKAKETMNIILSLVVQPISKTALKTLNTVIFRDFLGY